MSNFKRYIMVIRRDAEGFATPALKVRQEGEVLKFDEVKELLQTGNPKLPPCPRNCGLPTDAYELGFTHCPYCGRQLAERRRLMRGAQDVTLSTI